MRSLSDGISFCIITGGQRQDRLEGCICSIIRQGLPKFEILVTGNYHDDERVRYSEKKQWAASAEVNRMRNHNCERANYETIIQLDDDAELTDGWWQAIKGAAGFDLAGCRGVDGNGERWWDWQRVERNNPLAKPELLGYEETDEDAYISGYFMMMSKSVWMAVKFDEERRNYQHDDVDFCHRLTAAGYKIKIYPNATVIHHVDARGRQQSEQARKEFIDRQVVAADAVVIAAKAFALHDYEKSAELYGELAAEEPSFDNLYNAAYSHQRLGNIRLAEVFYLQALGAKDRPEARKHSLWLHLAEVLVEDKQPELPLAERYLTDILHENSKHTAAAKLLKKVQGLRSKAENQQRGEE